jgi:hypothetical protein
MDTPREFWQGHLLKTNISNELLSGERCRFILSCPSDYQNNKQTQKRKQDKKETAVNRPMVVISLINFKVVYAILIYISSMIIQFEETDTVYLDGFAELINVTTHKVSNYYNLTDKEEYAIT